MLIIYTVIIASVLIFIFFALKKTVSSRSVFKETIDIINEIMSDPDNLEENDEE